MGYQCVDCVAEGNKSIRQPRTIAGATMSSQRATPLVTYILIALNVAVFGVTAAQSGSVMNNAAGSSLFADWALVPVMLAAPGEWIRVIGSGFLHFGIMHLAVNMLVLWIIGRDVEAALGRARYLSVYLIALLGGSASVVWFQSLMAPTAGASGAVYGLMGALAVILLRLRRSPGSIVAVIALNIVISISVPGISLFGHLGGLVAGAAATAGLLYVPQWRKATGDTAAKLGWAAVAVVAIVTIGLIAARALQLRQQFVIG
ncbi:rhomboid family protein [Rhodococcus rhodnii LMG 5362]|uniref:Rhomboid family protein n=1 Tax=Rhodococcus rhodnii LMG 5362 TaxID=1273125 RepID=R7WGS5_9NOCA|nr:rhomboid family protein [Rhodococcus rhodnii LMG 5362]